MFIFNKLNKLIVLIKCWFKIINYGTHLEILLVNRHFISKKITLNFQLHEINAINLFKVISNIDLCCLIAFEMIF